jgi:pimeloyl-[acyl-carrier protein] synthase
MSTAPSTPTLADRFFVEAMSPAFREDPYPHYERFRGPAPLLRVAETI